MGAGIGAGIPIILEPEYQSLRKSDHPFNEKYFSKGFFDNYYPTETESGVVYMIKEELFINHYKSFLTDFYNLIEEDFPMYEDFPNIDDWVPQVNNMDELFEVFDARERGYTVPCINSSGFSILGADKGVFWMFYSGSYKAYLEEYRTLKHIEKILSKAIDNPLANAVKFGIYG